MKKILFISICLFIAGVSFAQDSLTRYFDEYGRETTKDSASFIRKQIKSGKDWEFSTYSPAGVLRAKGRFSSDSPAVAIGTAYRYFENGNLSQSVNYKAGKAFGLAINYHENGMKRAEGNYESEQLDGDWTGYYESGKIAAKVHYEQGEQKAGSFYNEDGTVNKDINIFYRQAEFAGGNAALATWLSHALVYPKSAQRKKIEGQVVVAFIVKKDGTLDKIHIAKSVEASLDTEALRVIKQMPRWLPGLNGGTYAEAYMMQPVTFQLEPRR